MRKSVKFNDPKLERQFQKVWKLLRKNNPFKGMTTKEILSQTSREH